MMRLPSFTTLPNEVTMAFSLCPDDGLPRLWRFVARGALPSGVLCKLDERINLLTIDKEAFDQLPELERHMVLRTQRQVIAFAEAA
jgi:hypothetical protein